MPSIKDKPNVGTIYLYDDSCSHGKSRWSKFVQFINICRRNKIDDIEEKRKGIIKKDGRSRIRYIGLAGYRHNYLHDFYISLIDLKWRYLLPIALNLYLVHNIVFSILWWLTAYSHGDFDNVNNPDWELCVSAMNTFARCMAFAIETQATIGYGHFYPNTDCKGSLFVLFIHITCTLFMHSLVLGFIFAKFAQPKKRDKTILFSKHACITHHNDELSIQIRVGDMRKTHLVAAHVHGVLVRNNVTVDGVRCPLYLRKVAFQIDSMNDKVVLMWPIILTHQITNDSPFWDIKPADFTTEKYELLLFIEGYVESNGEFCQARTSYTPKEFLWGHRFDRNEEFNTSKGCWEVDFNGFNDVVYTSNIRHSAKELNNFKMKRNISSFNEQTKINRTTSIENMPASSYVEQTLQPKQSKSLFKFISSRCRDSRELTSADEYSTNEETKLIKTNSMTSFLTADDSNSVRAEPGRKWLNTITMHSF